MNSHRGCSVKKMFLNISQISQVLYSEFCKTFKSNYFEEYLRTTAFVVDKFMIFFTEWLIEERRLIFLPAETFVRGCHADLRHAPNKIRICAEPKITFC